MNAYFPNTDQILQEVSQHILQSEVVKMKGAIWQSVARELAERHPESAKKVILNLCGELRESWAEILKANPSAEPVLQDALQEFQSEASQYGLR